jgi:hypothetical protein
MVINTKADNFLTHIPEWKIKKKEKTVLYKLGSRSRYQHLDKDQFPDIIDYSNNSPYMAIIAAYKMGINKIGLIGVDFTDNHFYAKDGAHNLIKTNRTNTIIRDYKLLNDELKRKKVMIYNLSKESILDFLPKIEITKFISNE